MRQFGKEQPGKIYRERPGGYGVIFDKRRRILAVSERGKYFLPGGGVETGESAEDAFVREAAEETGLTVRIVRVIGCAGEYVYVPAKNACYNKVGTFYLAAVVDLPHQRHAGEYPGAIWMSVDTFVTTAAHESHVWAVRQAITDSNQ